MFSIRMSDDSVGVEASSHEERRKPDLFCCSMWRNLVVIGEMVDVERGSILFKFTDMYVKCSCLEEAHNVFGHLQNQDIEACNTLFSTLNVCGSIQGFLKSRLIGIAFSGYSVLKKYCNGSTL